MKLLTECKDREITTADRLGSCVQKAEIQTGPCFAKSGVARSKFLTRCLAWLTLLILSSSSSHWAQEAPLHPYHAYQRRTIYLTNEVVSCDSIDDSLHFVATEYNQEEERYSGLLVYAAPILPEVTVWAHKIIHAINNNMTVAGQDDQGYVWIASDDFFLQRKGDALDINEHGTAVGYVVDENVEPPVERAAAWMLAGGEYLQVQLQGLGGPQSRALAINDHGEIVGWAEDGYHVRHAARWTLDGSVNALDTAWRHSWANDINNSGLVVGAYQPTSKDTVAFLWDPSNPGIHGLPDLGGGAGEATSINDWGWVVGRSTDIHEEWAPFVMLPGDLPDRLPGAPEDVPRAINEVGRIIGDTGGIYRYAVLWSYGAPYSIDVETTRLFEVGQEVSLHATATFKQGMSERPVTFSWEQIPAPGHSAIGIPVVMESVSTSDISTDMSFTTPDWEATLQFRVTANLTTGAGYSYSVSKDVVVTVLNTAGVRVYVSSLHGVDSNSGSSTSPVATLEKAVSLAAAAGENADESPLVFVEMGTYEQDTVLVLNKPIRLYGGFYYDGVDSWTRPASEGTVIFGDIPAISIDAPLTQGAAKEESLNCVVIDGFVIYSGDGADASGAGGDGASSVCVDISRGALIARNNVFRPGPGGDGAKGATGSKATPGGKGEDAESAGTVRVSDSSKLAPGEIALLPVSIFSPEIFWKGGMDAFSFGRPGLGGRGPNGLVHGGPGGDGGGFAQLAEWAETVPRKDIGPGLFGNPGEPGNGQSGWIGVPGWGLYGERSDWCGYGGIVPIKSTTAMMFGLPGISVPASPRPLVVMPDREENLGGRAWLGSKVIPVQEAAEVPVEAHTMSANSRLRRGFLSVPTFP